MLLWTEEIDNFIRDRIPLKEPCDKTMLLLAINERFGTHFTKNALTTNCTTKKIELGIVSRKKNRNPNQKPLFSENEKKGMIRIKVAEPNVWKQKQVYIYENAHNCKVPKGNVVIFLNSNNRDFSVDNLYVLTRPELAIINRFFGGFSTDAEKSISYILRAKIMLARHQRAREIGDVNSSNAIKSDAKERYERNKNNPEWRRGRNTYQKKYYEIHKREIMEKQREYRKRKKNEIR